MGTPGDLRGPSNWAHLETRISNAERVLIRLSPIARPMEDRQRLAYFPAELDRIRYEAQSCIGALRGMLGRGLDLKTNSDAYGLALRVAAVELRHKTVTGWPGFALLMRKMLGDAIVPWLPSLFLAAVALPDVAAPDFDLAEVLAFGTAAEMS